MTVGMRTAKRLRTQKVRDDKDAAELRTKKRLGLR